MNQSSRFTQLTLQTQAVKNHVLWADLGISQPQQPTHTVLPWLQVLLDKKHPQKTNTRLSWFQSQDHGSIQKRSKNRTEYQPQKQIHNGKNIHKNQLTKTKQEPVNASSNVTQ
ncbi:unnamed protein product [Cuscuta campestris]|uniref:Uncharacterized protein n=1 Tax=Cuscuta campestris TaxID=132261 RepID=A0A484KH92_9ASTE|nr:unnamed protein product [Cuscuta campestris]